MRPLQEIKDDAMQAEFASMAKHADILTINLDALDETTTHELVTAILGCEPHSILAKEIHQNSGGIPMVIEMIASGLKARNALRLENGIALLVDDIKISADESDAGSLISSQFDQLSPKFQLFLKVACISGFSFALELVVRVFNDLTKETNETSIDMLTTEEAMKMIEEEDVYDFLNRTQSAGDSKDIQSFRHLYIQKGIRSLVITEMRRRLHFQFFLYIDHSIRESKSIMNVLYPSVVLDIQLKAFGVPVVEALYHLTESGDLLEARFASNPSISTKSVTEAKAIIFDYQMQVAAYYCSHHIYEKAITTVSALLESWKSISLSGSTEEKLALPDALTRAKYYSMLSYIYWASSMVKESFQTSAEGLSLLQIVFPKTAGKIASFCFQAGTEIIKYNIRMRRLMRRVKRKKHQIQLTVDFSVDSSKMNLIYEMLSLMASIGLFVNDPVSVLVGSLKGLALAKNVFLEEINFKKVEGIILGETFRRLFGGNHTAMSISLMCFGFAEECLRFKPYLSTGVQDLIASEVEESFEDDQEIAKAYSEPQKEENQMPLNFTVVGDLPAFFSIHTVSFILYTALAARGRDYLELQAKYFRIAFIIIAETGDELFMSNSMGLLSRNYDPIISGSVQVKSFKQFAWGDAVTFAAESLNMELADKREQEFWHMTGEKDPILPLELEIPESQQLQLHIPKASCEPLPEMLQRDLAMNFLQNRMAHFFLTIEDVFSRHTKGPLSSTDVGNLEKRSIHLKLWAKFVDKQLKEPMIFVPAVRILFILRMVTGWQLWGSLSEWRLVFMGTQLSTGKDFFGVETATELCKRWSKLSVKCTIKIFNSIFAPHLRPFVDGALSLCEKKYARTIELWGRSLKIIEDFELGKPIPSKDKVGEFREPREWHGIRFFRFHRAIFAVRCLVVEVLQTLPLLLVRRKDKNGSKVVPYELGTTLVKLSQRLTLAKANLERFGGFSNLECLLAVFTLNLIEEIQSNKK
ncbi:hypothetical protein HDU97_008901 [Phlyctochytrium planicorne]|nr:hypothetical protein HDU97_008901 [Phlyctochytrium planicorne]